MKNLFFLAFAVVATSANAQLNYSTGFENPPFNNGTLSGQDGWLQSTGTLSQGSVQSATVLNGSQAAQIGPSSLRVAKKAGAIFNAVGSVVTVTSDIRLATSGFGFGNEGYGGIGVYNSNTTISPGSTSAEIRFLTDNPNMVQVRAKNSAGVLTTLSALGTFVVTSNTWYTMKLEIDYSLTANNVKGFFGLSGGSLTQVAVGTLDITTNVASTKNNLVGAAGLGVDLASDQNTNFDNFGVTTNVVPEPTSVIALGVAAVTLVRRKRNS